MSPGCLIAYFGQTWPHCASCYLRLPRNGSIAIVCWGCPPVTRYQSIVFHVSIGSKWTLTSSLEGSFHQKTWETTQHLLCLSVSPHFGILTSHGIRTIQTLPGIASSIQFTCKCHGWDPGWIECYHKHFPLKVLPSNGVNLHPHRNPLAQPPLPDLSLKQLQVLCFWVKDSKSI